MHDLWTHLYAFLSDRECFLAYAHSDSHGVGFCCTAALLLTRLRPTQYLLLSKPPLSSANKTLLTHSNSPRWHMKCISERSHSASGSGEVVYILSADACNMGISEEHMATCRWAAACVGIETSFELYGKKQNKTTKPWSVCYLPHAKDPHMHITQMLTNEAVMWLWQASKLGHWEREAPIWTQVCVFVS